MSYDSRHSSREIFAKCVDQSHSLASILVVWRRQPTLKSGFDDKIIVVVMKMDNLFYLEISMLDIVSESGSCVKKISFVRLFLVSPLGGSKATMFIVLVVWAEDFIMNIWITLSTSLDREQGQSNLELRTFFVMEM